jgi:hypothetical protein
MCVCVCVRHHDSLLQERPPPRWVDPAHSAVPHGCCAIMTRRIYSLHFLRCRGARKSISPRTRERKGRRDEMNEWTVHRCSASLQQSFIDQPLKMVVAVCMLMNKGAAASMTAHQHASLDIVGSKCICLLIDCAT